jgi:Novel STAND NTPase 1
MAALSTIINEQNPWPWLDPFNEEATRFFNGRSDDAATLLRMVRGSSVTVLFGKSGLGKTSLLQAGLFPALRKERLLPVYVRLRYDEAAGSLQEQLWNAFVAECGKHQFSYREASGEAARSITDSLWLYLHHRPLGLAANGGPPWEPVFVLDQFEEVFTIGSNDSALHEKLFSELGDLLENRIPRSVANRIEEDVDLLDAHDLDKQPYRFLVSLREDYLPDLELWSDQIPRLGPNRYRLLPMGRTQALEAIVKTGGNLVTELSANRIVNYMSRTDHATTVLSAKRGRRSSDVQVEPALLSLVCSGLNAKRIAANANQLDTENLAQLGGEIIEGFYDERLAPMPAAVRRLIERELITSDGVRLQYPIQSALAQGEASQEQINQLVGQRILRIESIGDSQRVELVHDRLAAVALKRRQEAEQRDATERRQLRQDEAARLDAERRKAKQARRITWTATFAAILVALAFFYLYQRAATAEKAARTEKDAALKSAQEALAAQRKAEEALAEARRAVEEAKYSSRKLDEAYKANPALAKSMTASGAANPLVYLQIPRNQERTTAERLQKQLKENGYDAPGIESVSIAPKRFELRYFRDAEQVDAEKLAGLIKKWNYGDIQVHHIKGYETHSRLKQFEIWFPSIDNDEIARLVAQINANSADERKRAVALLERNYRASSVAIAQVLDLFQTDRIKTLSPSGTINGFYFLSNTDPESWNKSFEKSARDAIARIAEKKPGPQTKEQIEKLRTFLDGLNKANIK